MCITAIACSTSQLAHWDEHHLNSATSAKTYKPSYGRWKWEMKNYKHQVHDIKLHFSSLSKTRTKTNEIEKTSLFLPACHQLEWIDAHTVTRYFMSVISSFSWLVITNIKLDQDGISTMEGEFRKRWQIAPSLEKPSKLVERSPFIASCGHLGLDVTENLNETVGHEICDELKNDWQTV